MYTNQVFKKSLGENVKIIHNQTCLGHFFFTTGCQCFIHSVAALQIVPAIVHGSKTHQKHEHLFVAQDKMFQTVHGHHDVCPEYLE